MATDNGGNCIKLLLSLFLLCRHMGFDISQNFGCENKEDRKDKTKRGNKIVFRYAKILQILIILTLCCKNT